MIHMKNTILSARRCGNYLKKRRETEEFKDISEKAKLSQQHNEHVHYLAPSGYAARRTKWCVDDPITSLTGYESTDPSALSSELTGRSYDWIRARTKPREGGGYYFPNDKTKEVFDKMGELQRQVSDGSWTPEGHDDILSRALGQKDHGGRVRGVGGGAKIKDIFGSGKTKHSGLVSVDELTTITQEITKKVHKEFEEKMNEMMNSKLEGIFNQLKQMGVSISGDQFVNNFATPKNEIIRSSCQSVHDSVHGEDHFTNLKTPTLCCLWVIHLEERRVIAARGTVFPLNSGGVNMIHNSPIVPHNVKLSVDDVVAEYQLTPLPVPCDEHETVGNAAGSFVQWPKDLVTLGQEPILLEKKKSDTSLKKNVQVPEKVESKGSVTPIKKTPPLLDNDIHSSEHCRSRRFLLNKRPPTKKSEVFKYEENGEDPIYITPEDVDQFLKMSWLNISVLEIFLNNHWMLLLFCLKESAIYVFDPLKQERKIRLATPSLTAYKLYVREGGLMNNRKEFRWHHSEVQCPQQEGGTECGFFVMRYMHDIIMLSQKNSTINWKVGLGSRNYTKKEIKEIRELWAQFFTLECF
ncbi:uncharacterized protein LOC141670505 isoform X1 [Apium graveolens]|uniref:uncharacterized protein LOC141670505 isoform X1 n=2 Tax=Apium graveolens TaxID=4045 RepID=UPI003D79CDAD